MLMYAVLYSLYRYTVRASKVRELEKGIRYYVIPAFEKFFYHTMIAARHAARDQAVHEISQV